MGSPRTRTSRRNGARMTMSAGAWRCPSAAILRRSFGAIASSPIIRGDLCFFYFGPDEKSRLIAVNKRTGETAWQVEPPKVDPSEREQMARGPGGGGPAGEGAPGGGRGGQGGRGGDRGNF